MTFQAQERFAHSPFSSEGWFPRCAVFDCDGVLMDTESGWVETVAHVSEQLGIENPRGLADKLTALPAEKIAHELAHNSLPETATAEEILTQRDALLERLAQLDDERIRAGVDLIPGVKELLLEISTVLPVAVASNSARTILKAKLEAGKLTPYLSTWVSCDDVPAAKPAPDMYLEAIRRLGFYPEQALTFEDSVPGATAAVASGTCVVVLGEAGEQTPPGHFVVSDFRDPDFLAQVRRWLEAAQAAGCRGQIGTGGSSAEEITPAEAG